MKTKITISAFVLLYFGADKFTRGSNPEVILNGSFIVNTGVVPQNNNNGLKPFGLIYDLVKNYQVPIKWVIEPTKVKDGVDFVYNNVDYKGGPFIVPSEFITPTVTTRISYWQGQGVVGVYTAYPISVPVYATITNFPVIMIDTLSNLQAIIENYYVLAGIPPDAYTLGAPAGLDQCYDIWTNPHGDPTWATHGPLYNFVTNIKGWIWGQCHAVSMMEDVVNPAPPNEQLNFLTINGLKCWQSGGCGAGFPEFHAGGDATPPFTYYNPTDPEMQFMLNLELATQAGSERWFQPISTGGWRPSTKVGVSTGTGTPPTQGVLAVYGPAYGDTANGRVMYVAGHSLTSGGGGVAKEHKVSAIRTYFNFMLLAGEARSLDISASLPPSPFDSAAAYPVSVSVNTTSPSFTVEWSSQNGGSFDNPNDTATIYHAPPISSDGFDIVRVEVTDQCGHVNFVAVEINAHGYNPLPVSLIDFNGEPVSKGVELEWSTASEINNDYYVLERSTGNLNFKPIGTVDGAGTVNTLSNYSWIDKAPLKGTSYYRLVQTDFDGTQKIYGPISVYLGDSPFGLSLISVYPNPSTGDFFLTYSSEERCETLLEVMNAEGKRVHTEVFQSLRGTNIINVKSSTLGAKGIYFVRLSQGKTKSHAERIVKK